jgi:hypothetical protein
VVSSKDRVFAQKRYLDGYKGILLALKVKFFIGSLHFRCVPIRGPAIKILDLPLITVIDIAGRERDHLHTRDY